MKVEIENLAGYNKKLTIEVPPEMVQSHMDDYFREIQSSVTLKGFRKGKAPLSLVRSLYGENAKSRVTQKLVESHLWQALRDHSLSPVTMPQVDADLPRDNEPFRFSATFEAAPPVELKDYNSLRLEKPAVVVQEEEINRTLETLRDQLSSFEKLDENATAASGLFAHMDYTATEAGQEVPEATQKDAFLELGNESLAPDFEKHVFGMKAGESRNFTVKFPIPEKPEERLPVSGRTLDFAVTIKELREKQRPELNDEFAQKLGPFATLAELRSRIIKDLENQKGQQQHRDFQDKALDFLIEKNPLEVSETLVNQQMEQLAMDAGVQLSQMGLDEKAIEERLKEWGDQIATRARRQVQASMLLGAISEKEKIQAGDEDIRQELTRIATQSRRSPKEVFEDLQKRGLMGGLIKQVTELKALDWVVQQGLEKAKT